MSASPERLVADLLVQYLDIAQTGQTDSHLNSSTFLQEPALPTHLSSNKHVLRKYDWIVPASPAAPVC